jgi:hypothetical protein
MKNADKLAENIQRDLNIIKLQTANSKAFKRNSVHFAGLNKKAERIYKLKPDNVYITVRHGKVCITMGV